MSGTDLAYGLQYRKNWQGSRQHSRLVLCAYALATRYPVHTIYCELLYLPTRLLRACYEMPGTDVGYGQAVKKKEKQRAPACSDALAALDLRHTLPSTILFYNALAALDLVSPYPSLLLPSY
eukprot:3941846-Rhodomonas_salina.4